MIIINQQHRNALDHKWSFTSEQFHYYLPVLAHVTPISFRFPSHVLLFVPGRLMIKQNGAYARIGTEVITVS